jgi:hypothetical protein
MDRLNALSRGTQLMLGGGVLLLIDSFLHWQEVSAKLGNVTIISVGVNAWHGFWGVVMCLALIVLLVWIVAKAAGIALSLPVSDTLLAAGLAAIVLGFAVIKNLADSYSTKWSYIGIVLAAVVALGAWREVEAAGGLDTLRSEVSSMTATDAKPAPPPAAEPPAAPPPESPAPGDPA